MSLIAWADSRRIDNHWRDYFGYELDRLRVDASAKTMGELDDLYENWRDDRAREVLRLQAAHAAE